MGMNEMGMNEMGMNEMGMNEMGMNEMGMNEMTCGGITRNPFNALVNIRLADRRDKGSAVIEFVLLAIPLFLPLILYSVQFASLSSGEIKARSLVREIVRAYVSADNENSARGKSAIVMNFGANRLNFSNKEISTFHLEFSCSNEPCFSTGGRVRATLEFEPDGIGRKVRVSAEEYVSPWQ
jgi:hypothetical protein